MLVDLFKRKKNNFVLWRVPAQAHPPSLYIGQPNQTYQELPLQQSPDFPELWEIPALSCNLIEGQVYHYWFKIHSTNPYEPQQTLYCTDPIAYTIDRQILSPTQDPASVILYRAGLLTPCDPQGQTFSPPISAPLPPNPRLVLYELPVRWTKGTTLGIGTFRDARSLLLPPASHLPTLGINALELLPPADSEDQSQWGYGTANFFAADFDLGHSESKTAATTDLLDLINQCRQQGIRFFLDMVMAFARKNSLRHINFSDFFIEWSTFDRDPEQGDRDGFGGDLFKFNYWVEGYHPITGQRDRFVPAREYLKLYLIHWMQTYGVNGLRLDSVNNIGNYDFLQEFKDLARQLWLENNSPDQFLVVGEELSVPMALLHQNRLDSLWNERFKQIIRQVILGKSIEGKTFEETVRQLIDCRLLGFRDGTQAINYITSHDVGGYGNERFYNYLTNNGIIDTEPRIKLAFVCLLTAVGIPMILAGEEFADQHDLDLNESKQVDPVNYTRMNEEWRSRLYQYVARLTQFRTTSDALALNDTVFIHVDFEGGKRVLVWRRGYGETIVIVVANFSDYGTPNIPGAEYRIPNFPEAPYQKRWKEITGDRIVPEEWVGREPIFPWEAKVYGLV
jgi:1,4-alpha-glucan branching enzyme